MDEDEDDEEDDAEGANALARSKRLAVLCTECAREYAELEMVDPGAHPPMALIVS